MSALVKKLPFSLTSAQAGIVLIILHTVGVIGILSPFSKIIISLTPVNLLISSFLVLLFHPRFDVKFVFFFTSSFVIGMGAEWIGVHTALLFGKYQYGNVLGPSLDGIPYIIGFNWFMLSVCMGTFSNYLKASIPIKSFVGAILMVIMDYIIEPVAIKLHFWTWDEGEIPLFNYTSWFFVSFFIQLLYHSQKNQNNPIASWLILSQVFFFIILQLV
jgi:bisanhydrobacterioruberin hydratase